MSLIGAEKREHRVVRRERERERTAVLKHRPMCNVNA